MRTILFEGATRRWVLSVALLAGLATLLVTLAPSINAQQPEAPHWFWGRDADLYSGAVIKAFNQNGVEIDTGPEGSGVIDAEGGWFVVVSLDDATHVTLRIVSASGDHETALMDVIDGEFNPSGLSITAFAPIVEETIAVRIIARRADDGRIEFGMRGPDGADILPPARFFPNGGPGHSRWLRSTVIDFGDGFEGRLIARYVEADGRTEFGFRVVGHDEIFPQARFFPAEGPNHNRWLRSSEIEIGLPQ